MAAIEVTRTRTVPANLFGQTITNLIATFATWSDARATRRALNSLSDRELDDIGLSRGDIDLVIRNN